ncbi:MAG: Flp pilus assembly complex ATPase component TadA, partial [Deltaproteobacteria bacterium]|nr:Flp pilus assembly complex ATPase component TadA [Deltaproteobacteria bacterium]
MAHAAPTTGFKDIVQGLVDGGMITHDQLLVVQEARRNLGGNLGQILLKRGFVDREQLLRFLSETLHIPVVKLNGHSLDPDLIKLVPASVAKKYQLVPLRREKDVLTVAMSDPLQVFALDEIRDALKLEINPVLASTPEIERLQHDHYHEFSVNEVHSDVEVLQYGVESEEEAAERLKEMAAGAKVVAQVNAILQSAVAEGASDIHIEPQSATLRIRTRVDGVLEERMMLPKSMHLPVVSRIKVMSAMDIAERRVPQDGRVRVKVAGHEVDIRVSTYPTIHGEKAVLRLFRQGGILGLKELGLQDDERKRFEQLITRPHGILLVTGPTGSGKSTTLYAALGRINSQDKNIISIEDPIEHEV